MEGGRVGLQKYTKVSGVYKGIHRYTRVYKGIEKYTRAYGGIQEYTGVYKSTQGKKGKGKTEVYRGYTGDIQGVKKGI